MGGIDEFLELQSVTKGPRCGYQLLDISDSDRKALDEALAAARITARAIQKWCELRGQKWADYNIQRHRRGDCRCQKI
jgi:hypothetical protein